MISLCHKKYFFFIPFGTVYFQSRIYLHRLNFNVLKSWRSRWYVHTDKNHISLKLKPFISSSAYPYTSRLQYTKYKKLFMISWCSKKCLIKITTIYFQFRISLHKQIEILDLNDNFLFMISWCFIAFETISCSSAYPYTNKKYSI
jgi:hypothetical protein